MKRLSGYIKIDYAIVLFLLYHSVIGYRKGVKKVVYDFIKFLVAWLIASGLNGLLFDKVWNTVFFQRIYSLVNKVIISPLKRDLPFMAYFPWERIVFYLLIIIFSLIAARIFLKAFFSFSSDRVEKVLGLVIGFSKGILYLFILVLLMDPLIQSMGSETARLLSKSALVPHLYEYNVLLDFFEAR